MGNDCEAAEVTWVQGFLQQSHESFLGDLNGILARELPEKDEEVEGDEKNEGLFCGLDWAFHIMTQFPNPDSREWFSDGRSGKRRRRAGQIWFS